MRQLLRIFIPLFLSIPIAIFSIDEIEIPLSDIVLVVGFIFFLVNLHRKSAIYLYVVSMFAFLSVAWIQFSIGESAGLRPYFSAIFFLKPLFAYFAAKTIVKTDLDCTKVLKTMGFLMSISVLLIFSDVVINHYGFPRAESSINGTILGIPQYAAYGVNSAASYYFVMFSIILYSLVNFSSQPWVKRFKFISLFCCAYLILGSLSREVILGFLLFLVLYVSTLRDYIKYMFVSCFVLGACLLWYFLSSGEINIFFLDAKIAQITEGFESGDFNSVSSGRFDLYATAINQWARSPLFGTGFHGYLLFPDLINFDIEPDGLSPHNQYLTTLWKGGVLFFVAYYAYVIFLLRQSRLFEPSSKGRDLMALFYICIFLIMANVWDVLMVPNFGTAFFFLLGVLELRFKNPDKSYA